MVGRLLYFRSGVKEMAGRVIYYSLPLVHHSPAGKEL